MNQTDSPIRQILCESVLRMFLTQYVTLYSILESEILRSFLSYVSLFHITDDIFMIESQKFLVIIIIVYIE